MFWILLSIILVLLIVVIVLAVMIRRKEKFLNTQSSGFKKVVYVDQWGTLADVTNVFSQALDSGVTHFILSFVVQPDVQKPVQVADAVQGFLSLSKDQQKSILDMVSSKNAKLMISFGGAISVPCPFDTIMTSYYRDPSMLASDLYKIVQTGGFHGVDFDLEHLIGKYYKGHCPSGDVTQDTNADAVSDYIAAVSKSLKGLDSSIIISHAPQYPYFGPSYFDVYTKVDQKAGSAIDFYNIQYYNNGDTSTYDLVFVSNPFAAAVKELLGKNVDVNKIVVGKSIQGGEIMDLDVFSSWIAQSASDSSLEDWRSKGGVMIWELFTNTQQSSKDIQNVLNFMKSVSS